MKILVVDDDKNICELISLYLKNQGYDVICRYDGSSALDAIKKGNIDLVVLDIMLPVIDGWEVCKMIRHKSNIPIIMLTARDMIEDKLQGFDIGADDYVVKPFDPRELIARIKARLKKNKTKNNLMHIDNLTIDMDKYEVKLDDQLVDLKPKEIQLLHFLLSNKNIVFSREQLLKDVWDYDYPVETRTVDVHIKSLRKKLETENSSWSIQTVWGIGYKLEVKKDV
ncbi:MAG: response regulator transcription factor [Clostridia bacterium]|nr:response regulator transcription factor [Clostridia bacterium]